MIEYLFVCAHNISRSPYCEKYFREFLKTKGIEGNVSSAGMRQCERYLVKEIYEMSDKVFVMEEWMKEQIIEQYGDNHNIIVLDIIDVYDNGIFNFEYLDELLMWVKDSRKRDEIENRLEIKNKLSLKEILDLKGLEKYVIKP